MLDVFVDSLLDSLKIFAIVLLVHILLSFVEEKISRLLEGKRAFAPALGGVFGLIPQCGVSVVGADLFVKGHLTLGTIIAIFLACSDEALPILFAGLGARWYVAFLLLGMKLTIAIFVGYAVDLVYRKNIEHVHEHLEHCEGGEGNHVGCCGHHIEGDEHHPVHEHLIHPLLHSLKIFAYVFVVAFGFGTLVYYVGQDNISNWLASNIYLSPLMAAVVGLIPNCVSSVLLSELYLNAALPFSALLCGLLINAGLGMLVLLRSKKTAKKAAVVFGVCLLTAIASGYAFMFIVL